MIIGKNHQKEKGQGAGMHGSFSLSQLRLLLTDEPCSHAGLEMRGGVITPLLHPPAAHPLVTEKAGTRRIDTEEGIGIGVMIGIGIDTLVVVVPIRTLMVGGGTAPDLDRI